MPVDLYVRLTDCPARIKEIAMNIRTTKERDCVVVTMRMQVQEAQVLREIGNFSPDIEKLLMENATHLDREVVNTVLQDLYDAFFDYNKEITP